MKNITQSVPLSIADRDTTTQNPVVSYGLAEEAWFGYSDLVRSYIQNTDAKRVADIGGGANPVLDAQYIKAHQIKYTMIDIDGGELAKAPDCYDKLQGDVTSPDCGADGSYDLVFSAMLAEHVKSGEALHRNLYRMLAPGGIAMHYFPTLYSPPFIANYFLPERLASKILFALNPRNRFQNAKFPAHYSWCRGPSKGQIARLEAIGYEMEMYRGFFGHIYYRKIPVLRDMATAFSKYMLKHPIPQATSFAWLVMRKPR
jgi:SAM-dependent methyltransferase